MRGRVGDRARLSHILEAILEIESYLVHADFEEFLRNSMMRFACIKQLEIIGEASTHISEELKSEFPEIPWSQIRGMRNVFIHEYFGFDSRLVWEINFSDIPDLRVQIEGLVDSFEK